MLDAWGVLKDKDLTIEESKILKGYREWKSQKVARAAERKEDIGKMLLTTSEMTDGATPRLMTTDGDEITPRDSQPQQLKTEEEEYGGSFSKKKGSYIDS